METLIVKCILSLLGGIIVGSYFARFLVWVGTRKWGKHYKLNFTNYAGKPEVVHIWTKQEELISTYILLIQEANNEIKKGLEAQMQNNV